MASRKGHRTKSLLTQPIVQPRWLVVALVAFRYRGEPAVEQAVWDEARGWVDRVKTAKLLLLLDRYGLPHDHPGSWLLLSLRLAEDHIEGFRVVEREPRRPGRPKGTHRIDRFELVKAVGLIRSRKDCTIAEACRDLVKTRQKPWRDLLAESLETRYYEQMAEFKAPKSKDEFILALEAAAARAKKSH